MRTKDIAERLLSFIQELTAFYAEISEELSENHLRIAVDNTRGDSELKKTPRKLLTFKDIRRNAKENLIRFSERMSRHFISFCKKGENKCLSNTEKFLQNNGLKNIQDLSPTAYTKCAAQ